jgi:7-cyano-7-deazaguanine synthase
MKKACVLTSGGVDSVVLLLWALARFQQVHPVYIRFGLTWEKAELAALKKLLAAVRRPGLAPLTVLDSPAADLYGDHWSLSGRKVPGYRSRDESVYLPGRNLLLLSKAAVWCAARGISRILLGTLSGNPFRDATPGFFRAMTAAASKALGTRLSVQAPFRRLSKTQVREWGRRLKAPLHLAFSCLSPKGLAPCGRCNKCAEKDKVLG